MPYPTGHRASVRKDIVHSARRLFNRHGFENVSVQQIMAGAGLTHGGFYSYFKSKSDLYTEVLGCFLTDPEWKSCWEGVHVDLSSTDVGPQVVRAYLSRQHFEDVENSCPMVALPSDVARSGKRRQAGLRNRLQSHGQHPGTQRCREESPAPHQSTSDCRPLCRRHGCCTVLADRALADELRDACMATALQLGNWDTRSPKTKSR